MIFGNNEKLIDFFCYIFQTDLSLDAMDSAGDQHLHIDHNIYKRRVDLSGNPIEEAQKEDIATSTKKKEVNIVRAKTHYGRLCMWWK